MLLSKPYSVCHLYCKCWVSLYLSFIDKKCVLCVLHFPVVQDMRDRSWKTGIFPVYLGCGPFKGWGDKRCFSQGYSRMQGEGFQVVQLESRRLICSSLRTGKSSFRTQNLKAYRDFGWDRASNPDYRDSCPEKVNPPVGEAWNRSAVVYNCEEV